MTYKSLQDLIPSSTNLSLSPSTPVTQDTPSLGPFNYNSLTLESNIDLPIFAQKSPKWWTLAWLPYLKFTPTTPITLYPHLFFIFLHKTYQFISVIQLCPTLCEPMNGSMAGLPVHHQLPEPTQTHIRWVGDVIQPFHPLSSPSPPALNLPQHKGLFQWVSSPHQVAKILEFQLQHQSFQWTLRTDLL